MRLLSAEDWELFLAARTRLELLPAAQRREALEEFRGDAGAGHLASLMALHLSLTDLEPGRLEPGTVIDNLTLRARLGEGGMGVVFEADQRLGEVTRRVAVKFIKPDLWRLAREDTRRHFSEEVRAQALLQFSGIARLYSTGTFQDPATGDEAPYLVMELVRGARSIIDFAAERRLALADRLALFHRVCRAVQYAHDYRIVHRDLKPANILVDSGGNPFVVDFGLARACDAELPGGLALASGTPAYMSPEQVSDAFGEISDRTDTYALGIILYQLLAGERPYQVPSARPLAEVVRAVTESATPPLVERALVVRCDAALAGQLDAVISAAMAKDPGARPSVSVRRINALWEVRRGSPSP